MKIFLLGILTLSSICAFASSDLRIGDEVLDNSISNEWEELGVVEEVFKNGKALVKFPQYGRAISKNSSDLSKKITTDCNDRLCKGDRVLDTRLFTQYGAYPGTVLEIYDNNKILVNFDLRGGSVTYVAQKDLSKGVKCLRDACVNDRVLINSNTAGTFAEVFDNGKVYVEIDGGGMQLRNVKDFGN